jgi:two-component system nitrate/nitrite response regulator NarL
MGDPWTHQIRVVVADPQPLYRESVVRAIRQRAHFRLIGEYADGRETLTAIVRDSPHVAVLDLALPSLDGAAVLHAVSRDGLPTRLIFLSDELSSDSAYRLVGAGAAGCLTKAAKAAEVCEAVATVAGGGTYLAAHVQSGIAREIRMRSRDERPLLSERELEVLRRIADGQSAPEICAALHVSLSTVKTHLNRLYDKLEVSERAAAVAVAMRRGLLE